MKLTAQQAVTLLTALGVQAAEVVDNETDSDYNEETAIAEVDAARTPFLEATITNSVKSKLAGMSGDKLTQMLAKQTGLARKEFDGKTDDEKVKIAVEHIKSLGKETEQSVSDRINEITNALNEEHTAKYKELETERDTWRNKYTDRDILAAISKGLEEAPLSQNFKRDIAASDLKRELQNKYHLQYDEAKGELQFFEKGNPEMPAFNDKKQPIKILDEAKGYFEPRNGWVTTTKEQDAIAATNKMAAQNTQYLPQQQQQGPQGQKLSYADQMKAATAAMAANQQ